MASETGATARTPRGSGDLLRERLLDAAVELVAEHGDLSHVSIRAVTKRAGVSPTAFYLHFASRDELLGAVIDRGFEAFRASMGEAVAAADDPPSRLLGAGLAYMRFAEEQPALYAIIFGPHEHAEKGEGPDDDGPGAGAFEDLIGLIRGYLRDEDVTEDRLRDLALGIWSGMHGYVTLCHAGAKEDWPDNAAFLGMLSRAWLGDYGR